MRYTIDELRSLKDRYRDPIYPGFSLEDVFEKRKQRALSLRRSDNAYTIRKNCAGKEQYSRQVRSEMNKLTENNFGVVLESLKSRPLLLEAEYRTDMVRIIHQKALQEPQCSKNYAAACRELADFEAALTSKGGVKPTSAFRKDIIVAIKKEFDETLDDSKITEADMGIDPESSDLHKEELREEFRTTRMRRKRANIRFIGELYLHDVISSNPMLSILETIMKQGNGVPSENNVEVVGELLTTIGERFTRDKGDLLRKVMDQLDRIKEKYSLRIMFMIMDLIDLQKNSWKPKFTASPTTAEPASNNKQSSGFSTGKAVTSNRFAAVSAPAAGQAPSSWRDVAKKDVEPPAASSKATKPNPRAAAAGTATGKRSVPLSPVQQPAIQPFRTIVKSMVSDWVERCDNDFIVYWVDPFNHCDRTFASELELGNAVAAEVILNACLTTHPNAQREAASFCGVALDLSDEEIFNGFAIALTRAVNEDLIEDCPKLPERWMKILSYVSDSVTDLFFDLGTICRNAYTEMIAAEPECQEKAADPVDDSESAFGDDEFSFMLQTLRAFWNALPKVLENGVTELLDTPGVVGLVAETNGSPPKAGVDKVLAAYLYHLHKLGALPADVVPQMREASCMTQPALLHCVADELQRAMESS